MFSTDVNVIQRFSPPKIKRKCLINKTTIDHFKPLESENFIFHFDKMYKTSKRTWEVFAKHKYKPHMRLTVSKHFLKYNGRYSIYCYIINLHNDATFDFVNIGNEYHLETAIENAMKLLTFKVLH